MHRKWILFCAVLTIAIFFVNTGIFTLHNSLKVQIPRYDPAESIPVLLLGGFRGMAVDFLWARAIARHEEKKYYELLTINDLISKLQPNFPAVWIFQAWNMSYNIAHEWDSPQNKWKWIRTGLKFAEKGATKNPGSSDLFFELGYMYFHLFDSRHFKYADYYREQWKRDGGEDNYETSLYWIKRSLLYASKMHNVLARERTVCHVLLHASLHSEKEGDLHKALNYTTQAIHEWDTYRKNHPGDTSVDVEGFLSELENRKVFLQSLTK
jgi:hypothetical protein